MDLVCIGSPAIDILRTPAGEMKMPGGSQATSAAVASMLGLKTGLIGEIGMDEHGIIIAKELGLLGVDTSVLKPVPETRSNQIDIATGVRTSRSSSWNSILDSDDVEYIHNSKAVFIQAKNPLLNTVAHICESSDIDMFITLHSITNGRVDPLPPALSSMVVRVIFGDDHEIPPNMESDGRIVAITRGDKGCTILQNGRKSEHAAHATHAKDNTGAGDTFAGAFIYGHMKEWPLDKTARFANRIAAACVMFYGSREFLHHVRLEDLIRNAA